MRLLDFLQKKRSVYFDLSFLKNNSTSNEEFTPRSLELHIFKNVKIKIPNPIIVRIYRSDKFQLPAIRKLLNIKTVNDENFDAEHYSKNSYLNGYFQKAKYVEKIRLKMLKDFQFPPLQSVLKTSKKTIQNAKNSVAVHVRRGDYLKPKINEHHGVVSLKYYRDAISYIESKCQNAQYFIFSDDPTWCASNFNFITEKTIIADSHFAWEDMYLMSICNHNVIANSSFSWWGAWLNKNESKIIVAPKKWLSRMETQIIPKDWIVL